MFVVHDLPGLALLIGAAFVAGVLNALAGGGSFLTLPALIQAGVPPVMANATGTVALNVRTMPCRPVGHNHIERHPPLMLVLL